eukprot:GHVN01072386.1.p1 GENE.GHVN01072386.1~~GHVN01072386.1.p1  ORF type:complete len:174 (+),score=41.34 GHVN01072386.1:474-995(+)
MIKVLEDAEKIYKGKSKTNLCSPDSFGLITPPGAYHRERQEEVMPEASVEASLNHSTTDTATASADGMMEYLNDNAHLLAEEHAPTAQVSMANPSETRAVALPVEDSTPSTSQQPQQIESSESESPTVCFVQSKSSRVSKQRVELTHPTLTSTRINPCSEVISLSFQFYGCKI